MSPSGEIEFHASPGWLEEGVRIYAVGDVHGCAARLDRALARVEADARLRPAGSVTLLYVGDLVDRGPDSAGAVARAMARPDWAQDQVVLMGNHEAMMLEALDGEPEAVAHWLENGGGATLASYGIGPGVPPVDWPAALPAEAVRFLRGLPLSWRAGGYGFVHAGVRAGTAFEDQAARDLLWMREPFLSRPADHGVAVVHGHTPAERPEVRPWRIGIDTGAVMGGRLTVAVLEGDRVGFLQA
jgi:serine/threonine protein phosphatase 1